MNKNRFIKTALCMVLAFAMTFAPVMSSCAMIATALTGEPATEDNSADMMDTNIDSTDQPYLDQSEEGNSNDETITEEELAAQEAATGDAQEGASEESSVDEENAQPAEDSEAETEAEAEADKTEYVWEDSKVRVTAVLDDPAAVPDDAELTATAISKGSDDYNYDAYIDALNNSSEKSYDESNTLLYDVAFIKDGAEIQPDGKVSVTFEFLDNQLTSSLGAKKAADVSVTHLPLADNVKEQYDTTADATDISADDINVEKLTKADNSLAVSVKNEKAVFETDSFSVFAYTVDFEFNGYQFSIPGGSEIKLSKVFEQLNIDKQVKDVKEVTFSNPDLVEVKSPSLLGNDWTLVSKKAFSTEETLTVVMNDGEKIEIKVTDAQDRSVKISLLEDDGKTPATDTGIDSNKGFFIVARLTDNKGTEAKDDDEIIGYQYKFVSAADLQGYEWTYDDSQFKKVDESGSISYDADSNHEITIRVYEGASYDSWRTNYGQITGLPDHLTGYMPLGSSTEGNVTTVSFRKGFPPEYQVEVSIDPSITPAELAGLSLYAEAIHASTGTDKYTGELPSSSTIIVLYDPNREPASTWTENPGGRFSGNEKTKAVVKDSNGNEIPSGSIVNGLVFNYTKRTEAEDGSAHETKYTDHIKITKAGEWEDAKDPYDILGEGAEYGVIANKYIQRDHTETNFATKDYENPNKKNIEIDGSGNGAMPFYAGEIHDHLWFSGANNVDIDIYVSEEYSSIRRGHQGDDVKEVIWDTTKDSVDVTVYPLPQTDVNSKVDELIDFFKHTSEEMAAKPSFALNFGPDNTIDTTSYPDGKTIYIDASNLDFSNGFNIKKLPDQTVVFNIPGEDKVVIKDFHVKVVNSDGTIKDVHTNTDGMGGYDQDVEDEILDHIVFNAYETKLLQPLSGPAGLFLAPNGNVVEDGGSGTGWIATGGTFDQISSEWHFFRANRHYKAKGDFSLAGQKKIVDSTGEAVDYKKFSSMEFTFELYPCDKNGVVAADAKVIETVKADEKGEFEFSKLSYTHKDVPEGESRTFYYVIKEKAHDNENGVKYDAHPVFVKVEATDKAGSEVITFVISKGSDTESWTVVENTGTDTDKVYEIGDFENTYKEEAGGLKIKKSVTENGKSPSAAAKAILAGKYTFTLYTDESCENAYTVDGKPVTVTLTIGADGVPVVSDEVTNLPAGDYWIKETSPSNGSSPVDNPVKVTVEAGKTGDAAVVAEFTNNLATTEGEVKVKKTLSGRDWTTDDSFEFTITPKGNAPAFDPNTVTITKDDEGYTESFGKVKFTKEGTYQWTVTETHSGETIKGVTYDSEPKTVTIVVTKNEDGELVADTGSALIQTAEFTNEYDASGKATLNAKKAGNDTLGERTFTFQLLDKDGELIETSDPVKQGETAAFKEIKYDLDDVNKEYTYQIREVLPAGATAENNYTVEGVKYDSHVETVKVKVTDNGDGTLKVTYDGKETFTTPEFKNSYEAKGEGEVKVKKTLSGRDWTTKDEFEFTITPIGEAPAFDPDTVTVTKDSADYTESFGTVEFTKAGTYQWTVTEKHKGETIDGVAYDSADKTVTIVVKDDGKGKLVADTGSALVQTAEFTNTYSKSGEGEIKVLKNLVGRGWATDDSFKFTITPVGNAPKTDKNEVTVTKDSASYTESFGKVKFTEAGTYKWTVKEEHQGETIDGITYDSSPKTVTIVVVDDGKGNLVADTGSALVQTAPFENNYSAKGEGEVKVKKTLSGRDWTTKDEFEFTISAEEGTPMPKETSVKITKDTKDYTDTFGTIEFKKAGTYTYTVTEKHKGETVNGVTYDSEDKTITIVVKDNGKGKLVAEEGSALVQTAEFTNTYKAEGEGEVKVKKILDGRNWTTEDEFEFTISAEEGTPMPAKTSVKIKKDTKDYTDTFGTIKFEKAGTYTYTVKETKGSLGGVTYEVKPHTVIIKVKDNGDGTLVADGTPLVVTEEFTNEYDAKGNAILSAKKAGNETLGDRKFKFELLDSKGGVIETSAAVKQGETVTFKEINYGLKDAGKEYTYKIKEVLPAGATAANNYTVEGVTYDNHVETVKVKVTDNGDGTLKVTYDGKETFTTPEFKNSYAAKGEGEVMVKKILTGRDWTTNDSFEFMITPVGDAPSFTTDKVTVTDKSKDYTESFGKVTFTKVGTYQWTVTETHKGETIDGVTYDSKPRTVTIKVKDNGDGTLVADGTPLVATAEFTNEYDASGKATLSAKKAGNETLGNRKFTFQLIDSKGGVLETSDAVKQGETATFKDLEYGLKDAGKEFTYKIREVIPAGATAENDYTVEGVKYDSHVETVKVKVTDNGDGTLKVTYDGKETFATPEFKNSYAAKGEGEVKVKKTLSGREWTTNDSFEFTITPVGDAPAFTPNKVTVTDKSKDYTESFGKVEFTKEGTYQWTVSETHKGETVNGIAYDSADKTVTIVVKDDGKGNLIAEDGSNLVQTAEFTNTYSKSGEGEIKALKNLVGRDWTTDDSFKFTITPVGNAPKTEKSEVTVTKDSASYTESFGKVKFTEAGTYQWTVKEEHQGETINGIKYDSEPKTVTIAVKDDGKGNLVADTGSALVQTAPFENNYSAKGEGEVKVKKTLEGRDWTTKDEFEFTISAEEGTPMPKETSVKITKDTKDYTDTFGTIEFKKAGTYTYTVTETHKGETIKGVTYDSEDKTVTIVVKDDGKGKLVAEEGSALVQTAEFTNTYKAKGEGEVKVKKTLEGRKWATDDSFEFTITPVGEAPVISPSKVTVTDKSKDYTETFGKVTFTKEGTYQWKVTETHNGETIDGIKYDSEPRTVTIKVKDNGDGTLVADGTPLVATAEFTNEYSAKGKGEIKVQKLLEGREWTTDDSFDFTISPEGDAPMPENDQITITKDDGDQTKSFGEIEFTEEGKYSYTVKETTESADGITCDNTEHTVTIELVDNGKGELIAKEGTETVQVVTVTNTYAAKGEGEIKVRKNLTGREWTDKDKFNFTISADEGTPMPEKKSITITSEDENQTRSFGKIEFTEEGEYTYIIKETKGSLGGITYDETEHTVTIKAVDDGKGHIIAAEDSDLIQTSEITNTYSAKGEGEIKVHKVLEGRKWNNGDAFTFTITGKNGAPMPAVSSISITKSDRNQTKSFGKIKFTKAGTYTYIVKESKGSLGGVTYDETEHEVTIKVVDNGKGEFVAAEGSSLVQTEAFTNTYGAKEAKGQIFVQKLLQGRAWTDNDQFTFTLSADKGTPMPAETSVTIRKSDADQTKSFGEIRFTEPGKYTYIVRETKGNISGVNYDTKDHKVTIEVVDDGNGNLVAKDGSALIQTVKITNTTGVKTGDENQILLPMAGMLTSLLALLLIVIRRRKSRA